MSEQKKPNLAPEAVMAVHEAIQETAPAFDGAPEEDPGMAAAKSIRVFIANANLCIASTGLVAAYGATGSITPEDARVYRHNFMRLLQLNTSVAEEVFFPSFELAEAAPELPEVPFPSSGSKH